jgi:hypothetical protein
MYEPCSVCGNENADLEEVTIEGDAIFLCKNCKVEDLVEIKPINLSKFVWKEVL